MRRFLLLFVWGGGGGGGGVLGGGGGAFLGVFFWGGYPSLQSIGTPPYVGASTMSTPRRSAVFIAAGGTIFARYKAYPCVNGNSSQATRSETRIYGSTSTINIDGTIAVLSSNDDFGRDNMKG